MVANHDGNCRAVKLPTIGSSFVASFVPTPPAPALRVRRTTFQDVPAAYHGLSRRRLGAGGKEAALVWDAIDGAAAPSTKAGKATLSACAESILNVHRLIYGFACRRSQEERFFLEFCG